MLRIITGILLVGILHNTSFAQYTFRAIIKNNSTKEPIGAVTAEIKSLNKRAIANDSGFVLINDIPAGVYTVTFSHTGFETRSDSIKIPLTEKDYFEVLMLEEALEIEEIIIQSTRTGRTIQNIPTRIEVIDFEEIGEKSNMRPTNVSMLLHESTGIQVQQTSYASSTQSLRMQGLDGRYTQILKDGFPSFGGFSSGLSILDIPPLDLKQVEIIKGSASTLYGGGAIAGVVNFVSREPKFKRETNIILNQTTATGTDAGLFSLWRNTKWGYSLLLTGHRQQAFDVDKDDFTEIPRQREFNVTPKLFFYGKNNWKWEISNSTSFSDRNGGDIYVVNGDADSEHVYFEKNKSVRNNSYGVVEKRWKNGNRFLLKQSVGIFERKLNLPDYYFGGKQLNMFTDASYMMRTEKHTWVAGMNYIFDRFTEFQDSALIARNQSLQTYGVYLQDNWDISSRWLLESGLRIDFTNKYGTYWLPRFSLLHRINGTWAFRLGGGIGYKTPTLFTEETEVLFYKKVLPLSPTLDGEVSIGGTFDINFRKKLGDKTEFSLNQMFFFTQIKTPLVLRSGQNQEYYFQNVDAPIRTMGSETNLKVIHEPFKLFAGYTYTFARANYDTVTPYVKLIPAHKINLSLLMEREGNYKLGLEMYWTGTQYRSDGSKTRSFVELGFFAEKNIWKKTALFINLENFTDVRQNKWEQVVFLPHTSPTFAEVYTHTEGFVANGGIKIKL